MAAPRSSHEIEIKPRHGWQELNLREMWDYRELFGFLVWRDITIRYKQTVLGCSWGVLQPLVGMLVFTLVFHRLAGIESDGPPYPLFVYAGLLSWMFFANAVSFSSSSLVGNQVLISKVYFPRILIPLGSIGAFLLDLLIGLMLLLGLMIYYHWTFSSRLLWFPLFVLGNFLAAGGLSLILSALNVYFRDVKYAVPFLIQMGMYVTPILYPLGYVPKELRILTGLNPVAGVAEGFRYSLLGYPAHWDFMGVSLAAGAVLFFAGLYIFRLLETHFVDAI